MKAIIKQDEYSHFLIYNTDDHITPFVVCHDFNGNDWHWGTYFKTIDDALEYFNEKFC